MRYISLCLFSFVFFVLGAEVQAANVNPVDGKYNLLSGTHKIEEKESEGTVSFREFNNMITMLKAFTVKWMNGGTESNVGVGTTNPTAKLHVAGDVQMEGNPDDLVLKQTVELKYNANGTSDNLLPPLKPDVYSLSSFAGASSKIAEVKYQDELGVYHSYNAAVPSTDKVIDANMANKVYVSVTADLAISMLTSPLLKTSWDHGENGDGIYYMGNTVAIGTTETNVLAKLNVGGDINSSGTICDKNGCIGSGNGNGNGNGNSNGNSTFLANWPDAIKCQDGGEYTIFYFKGINKDGDYGVDYGTPGVSTGKWIRYDLATGNYKKHADSTPGMSACFKNITKIPEFYFGGGGGGGSADNLGNHIATENLKMSGKWLSNDGDNEGLFVEKDGKVKATETVSTDSSNTVATKGYVDTKIGGGSDALNVIFSKHVSAHIVSAEGNTANPRYVSFEVTDIIKNNCVVSDTEANYCYLVVENFPNKKTSLFGALGYGDMKSFEFRLIYYPVGYHGNTLETLFLQKDHNTFERVRLNDGVTNDCEWKGTEFTLCEKQADMAGNWDVSENDGKLFLSVDRQYNSAWQTVFKIIK